MNGDINGIMAESEEVALPIPSSPNHKADETKVTQEDCDEDKNDCESSINGESCDASDNESINSTAGISLPDGSTAEHSQDLDGTPALITDTNSENVTHKTDTITKENHCEGSNGPDPESKNELRTENTNENSENKNSVKINGPSNEVCQDSVNEDDMEYDSMAEEGSAISGDARAEDTVSINSDSESGDDSDGTSEESESKNKIGDIIVLDNENRVSSNNSDVHEIDSDNGNDDCVIDNEKKKPSNELEDKVLLRRSSRAIKRKRYPDDETAVKNGDESDVEEVEPVDPLKRKAKPIVINDTKTLVAMAAKEMRSDESNNKKKETTVLIIDTNSASKKTNSMQQSKSSVSSNNSTSAQNLYQSIAARGTTVTPISNQNNNNATQTSQSATPAILPSLTDDMFVVEAPSFIVPYVYEKPSITAFREFVDKLGKQLEEEKIKEEMKEKEKREKEKEKRDKEKQERRERGEEVDSDDCQQGEPKVTTEEEANTRRKAKKNQRRMNEEDDASWDGESLSESDEEVMSGDENDKIVVKDKVEAIDHINVVADLTADKICSSKLTGKSSMDCSLGKFFINIGLNLVQEYVQSDLLKQQNRKLYKEKKAGHSTKATETSIAQLIKNLEFSKENNAPYRIRQEKCELCSFKTESKLVMAQHLETPHMNKNNVYKCNFCTFEIRSPHDILYHMESVHNVRGRLERAPSYHQCANCPFEDNGKGKMARHLIACAKKFKPESNLAPPVDWEPPAKIPKIAKPRNNVMSPYQNAFNRSAMGAAIRGPLGSPVAAANAGYKPRGRSPMAAVPRPPPVHGLPIMRAPSMVRSSALNMPNNFSVANNSKPKSSHQPSISITPLPRQPTPNQHLQPTNVASNKNSFVICEICDGYIKDLEQLRNHMQWIHKVKIHPKMIYNRPPLNCQKCQFRFFTDQGFERHLLGSHGLVTSSMQEAANKGKDAGRCPVCGRVYQWKLLNHVARDHNLTLKPGHLSYKCTVCTATFGMYKQFENHVYSAHSVVAKKVMDKNKSASQPAKSNSDTLLKPLKINEDITIIPQSVKSMAAKSAKK